MLRPASLVSSSRNHEHRQKNMIIFRAVCGLPRFVWHSPPLRVAGSATVGGGAIVFGVSTKAVSSKLWGETQVCASAPHGLALPGSVSCVQPWCGFAWVCTNVFDPPDRSFGSYLSVRGRRSSMFGVEPILSLTKTMGKGWGRSPPPSPDAFES